MCPVAQEKIFVLLEEPKICHFSVVMKESRNKLKNCYSQTQTDAVTKHTFNTHSVEEKKIIDRSCSHHLNWSYPNDQPRLDKASPAPNFAHCVFVSVRVRARAEWTKSNSPKSKHYILFYCIIIAILFYLEIPCRPSSRALIRGAKKEKYVQVLPWHTHKY